jgi:cytochrome c oxidase subunit II
VTSVDYGYEWRLPPPASTYAGEIDSLMWLLHVVMVAIFIIWGVYFAYCLVAYRATNGHRASYHTEGERASLIPDGLILAFEMWLILAFGIPIWAQIKQQTPPAEESLEVNLVGQQFAWNFQYAGPDKKFGRRDVKLVTAANAIGLDDSDPAAKDDFVTINNLHVPVGKPVILHMTSKDVIHSFQVTNFRNKQDLVPGLQTTLWFTPTEVGKYEIGCAQLCGIGHTQMIGNVFVETPEAFDAWTKEQLQARVATTQGSPTAPALAVETSDVRAVAETAPRS